jgi:predicted MFS family arabinose efflux permease
MTAGMALGAPLAGFAIDHRGWGAGFALVAAVGLLVAVVGVGATTSRRRLATQRADAALS